MPSDVLTNFYAARRAILGYTTFALSRPRVLAIFELERESAKTVTELANRCGVLRPSMSRALQPLFGNVIGRDEDGELALTIDGRRFAALLREYASAMLEVHERNAQSWREIADAAS